MSVARNLLEWESLADFSKPLSRPVKLVAQGPDASYAGHTSPSSAKGKKCHDMSRDAINFDTCALQDW